MPLVDVRGLVKTYPRRSAPWQAALDTTVVDRVSFSIEPGEALGLVGESGCGKTTTARCLLRLIEPTAGVFRLRGESVFDAPPARMRALRRDMQMVFQDPATSLNPRMRVGALVEEGLFVHRIGTAAERQARTIELFEMVGLDPAHRSRYPHEFSGGQRQRISLARALALRPSFLIADEPLSALDLSVQAQVVNLFLELQAALGLSMLFISHDLRLVRHLCSRVAVMYAGRIVELGPSAAVLAEPAHGYTRALLSAVLPVGPGTSVPRVPYAAAQFDREAELREVAPGHWAA